MISPKNIFRSGLIACIVIVMASAAFAQTNTGRSYAELMRSWQQSQPDTNRVKILLELARYYDAHPGAAVNGQDSAFAFAFKAKMLSGQLQAIAWQHECLYLLGEMYFEKRDYEQGRASFMQIIHHFQQTGQKEQEAATWSRLGNTIPDKAVTHRDSAFAEHMRCFERTRDLYHQTGNQLKEIAAIKDIADVQLHQGKRDSAEQGFLRVLKMYQSINYPNLHYTYDLLTAVSTAKGNYEKALTYAYEAVKSMQATSDSASAGYFYGRLAGVYREVGQFEQCIEWYRKAVAHFQRDPVQALNSPMYRYYGHLVRALIKQKREKEALQFLVKSSDGFPPVRLADKQAVAGSFGDCYTALQQYPLAEKYYLEMVACEEKMTQGNSFTFEVYYTMGEFYLNRQRYDLARPYLMKAMNMPPGIAIVSRIRDLHFYLYKIDSAAGNYLSAIQHFRQHKFLSDSLFNESKSKQIEELQVKYETGKKVENIGLLEQKNQLQQDQLKQAKLTGNLTIGAVILLLIIMALLYNRYRTRQRNNQRLEMKQEEINAQNTSLQELLTEKDKLLEEKEWLVKEIHHRVKNNLQIVISLLNTQTAYLDNEAALTAIRDSQHRMRAMSLIHQRLYQSEKACIDMQQYIRELMEYLDDNFNLGHRIRFHLQMEKIDMDVAQAVPVGLILNEAITNAIKYAFPGNREATITVSMNYTTESNLLLVVSDNGQGLPAGFDITKIRSLGMSLMQGLTRQLNGTFKITNNEGLQITIQFPDEKMTKYNALTA